MEYGPETSIKHQLELKRREDAGLPLPGLSEHDMRLVEKRKEEIQRQRASVIKAMFKIELMFGGARSAHKPFVGAISLWLAGSALSGDGDEKVYWCPIDRCSKVIHPQFMEPIGEDERGELVVCPACGTKLYRPQLVGECVAVNTYQNWAIALENAWRRVGGDADVVLKYNRHDVRGYSKLTGRRGLGGEELIKLHQAQLMLRYPLKNIIKDTQNGANLRERFLAFLKA